MFIVETILTEPAAEHSLAGSEDIPSETKARVVKQRPALRARKWNVLVDFVPGETVKLAAVVRSYILAGKEDRGADALIVNPWTQMI